MLTEEILMHIDNCWSGLIDYRNWIKEEICAIKIFGILLGLRGDNTVCTEYTTQKYKPLVSEHENCNLHLMLSELGKDRLKKRLQNLDVQGLDWHVIEQVAPLIEKCRKYFET